MSKCLVCLQLSALVQAWPSFRVVRLELIELDDVITWIKVYFVHFVNLLWPSKAMCYCPRRTRRALRAYPQTNLCQCDVIFKYNWDQICRARRGRLHLRGLGLSAGPRKDNDFRRPWTTLCVVLGGLCPAAPCVASRVKCQRDNW